MAAGTLEERMNALEQEFAPLERHLSVLEKELAQIKQQLTAETSAPESHPWDKVFGSFANSEGFDEAVRLGREYRESLRPKDDEDAA